MRSVFEYDVYIFDCDGVILDANQLKIDAMKNAVSMHFPDEKLVYECGAYFSENFGKSRFHHVEHFVKEILPVEVDKSEVVKNKILNDYSVQCKTLYMKADITPGFIDFIKKIDGNKYVASGSEQQELREVFSQRGLDIYFKDIYGSPTPKAELIKKALQLESSNNAIMFGDAESDLNSAMSNQIDFIFYSPFSNVKERMEGLCTQHNFPIVNDFSEVN